jgi:hypothetical protein
LQRLITDSEWDHHALIEGAADYALPALLTLGEVAGWALDDVSYVNLAVQSAFDHGIAGFDSIGQASLEGRTGLRRTQE